MSYFRRVILERSLFGTLGQISYRNFVITGRNLERLLENTEVDTYMDFFRTNYIQRAGQVPVQQPPATPTTGQNITQQIIEEAPQAAVGQEPAAYDGPFNTQTNAGHLFVMVVPSEGFNKELLVSNLNNFNLGEFPSQPLQITESVLDDFRILIQVAGLNNRALAQDYLQQLVRNRSVFEPLGEADYRNFIITPENLSVFTQRKNIAEYMDFYRKIYLGQ
jgi:hypothetical protein